MEHELGRLTYPEIGRYLKSNSLLFIPFGTVEAHGRHLPVSTDTLIARRIASELARRCGALWAPTLDYGITNSLFRYPAASYIDEKVYADFVHWIMDSFASHGFRQLILINGHGGNNQVLNNLVTKFAKAPGRRAAAIHWWIAAETVSISCFGNPGGHAAAEETALVLDMDESLVSHEAYSPADHFTVPEGVHVHPAPGSVLFYGREGAPPIFDKEAAGDYTSKVIDYLEAICRRILAGWDDLDPHESG
jgi:creatinine amidohydrolase